jgi:uncharacterized repeat protein (TIGR03803 family)
MLYGVNAASLPSATCQYGCGGIFRLSPDGLRFRARLLRKSEGDDPWTAPSFGSDGMLYGSAEYGGLVNQCGGAGCGTIWRASPDTLVIEAVHRLREHEGSQPKSIMMARDGNLYGVAQHGAGTAACPDCGSVFRISAGGKLDVLHVFGGVDGANPDSTLVETDDGSLWGTAAEGGAHRVGAAFRLSGY